MATFTKNKKSLYEVKTVSENLCLSDPEIGNAYYPIEKGEQLSINRHEIKQ